MRTDPLESQVVRSIKAWIERSEPRAEVIKIHGSGLQKTGLQDLIVVCPARRFIFVEVKRPGETLRPKQRYYHDKFTRYGYECYVIDSLEQAKKEIEF